MLSNKGDVMKRQQSLKYVEDNCILASYNLKKDIENDAENRIFPLTNNQRTGHKVIPDNYTIQN